MDKSSNRAGTKRARHGRRSRGQTRQESIIALSLFLIAGVGAWLLYGAAIKETTLVMWRFFAGGE